ncbi:stage II sporulation protein M [Portibacter lacus]|uniref:Membrane protein n=1 Tax=Portibacter lacus TaxID=1099794 RepID=A0AA37SMP7_9BACT|nr:stage II sporulation protein M [Portibacter lacus]GLR16637.1 membrane protein [Portibacter lacus]
MKEVLYIKKNQSRWKEFETFLDSHEMRSPDVLADYYIQLTDDLSYAKTFYPNSNLISYLNTLAAKAHTSIYRNKKEEKSRLLSFFKFEVPLAIWESRTTIGWALFIFLLSIGIGLLSNVIDENFTRQILGDSYVNMTLDNIEKGDPMAVYDSESVSMFIGIGQNNVKVALYAFVLGIFGSVISAFILITNGIMVGTFLHFFIRKGLFGLAFSTIFIHGALELSAIAIAGGAGMVLGNSFLFPGTFTRMESLKRGAKRSLKIMIGLIPVIIAAAVLESFVTKHYLEIGSIGRWAIIIVSFIFIIWYFIWYPRKLYRHGTEAINS